MEDVLLQLRESAMKLADTAVWALPDSQVLTCLGLAQQLEQAVAAAKLHLLREADRRDLRAADNAHSTDSWFSVQHRVTRAVARRAVSFAAVLERRPVLNKALVAGAVNTEQATVIADCVTTLPAEIGPAAVDQAERLLIRWAEDFDANGLRKLAARILEHVAPEIAEAREAAALEREEAAAHADRFFTMSSPYRGRVRLKGSLSVEMAAIVEAALEPLCSPRARGLTAGADQDPATVDTRRPEQVRADALVEVCALALRTGDLPVNGGEPPQMSVTVNFDSLADDVTDPPVPQAPPEPTPAPAAAAASTASAAPPSASTRERWQFGVGTLGNGARVSPATVRRFACDARILPAVLGTDGQVLDVGRTRRLIDGSLRRALTIRDQGCAFPGCTRPARWTEAHHIIGWAAGGDTSLHNAVLLCGPHHRTIHSTDWTVTLAPDSLPDFIPPPALDPLQRPRRNAYHRRT